MIIKTLIAWTLAAIISATVAATAIACSCGPKPSPKEALRGATIVFSGRVIVGRVVKRRFDNKSEEREMREFLFEVSDIWKGAVPKRVFILTGMGGGDCGYSFEIGERYLVYAHGDDTQFGTNICTRTNHENAADEDIQQLGLPTKQHDKVAEPCAAGIAPGLTACAPTRRPAPATFPHRLRRPPQSLSLGSFGD